MKTRTYSPGFINEMPVALYVACLSFFRDTNFEFICNKSDTDVETSDSNTNSEPDSALFTQYFVSERSFDNFLDFLYQIFDEKDISHDHYLPHLADGSIVLFSIPAKVLLEFGEALASFNRRHVISNR